MYKIVIRQLRRKFKIIGIKKLTLANDHILDLRDEINSLEFCLSNTELSSYVYIDKQEVLRCLETVSDRLIKKTSNFKSLLDISKKKNFQNKNELEVSVSNKISVCMSLALKIEYINEKLFSMEQVKVSQHVYDFIKDV